MNILRVWQGGSSHKKLILFCLACQHSLDYVKEVYPRLELLAVYRRQDAVAAKSPERAIFRERNSSMLRLSISQKSAIA